VRAGKLRQKAMAVSMVMTIQNIAAQRWRVGIKHSHLLLLYQSEFFNSNFFKLPNLEKIPPRLFKILLDFNFHSSARLES
jgi:hypothetical protein